MKKGITLLLALVMCFSMGTTVMGATSAESYTARMYTKALGREGSAKEIAFYADLLSSGQLTVAQMTYDVLNSNEFANRRLGNTDYVRVLYQAILNRTPTANEVNFYVRQLDEGASRNGILGYFITSDEFKTNCAELGLTAGTVNMSVYDSNPNIARFVTKLYRQILGRTPSVEEKVWRVELIAGGMSVAQTTYDIFMSSEFASNNPNISDEQFIKSLYSGILGRNSNSTERKHHLESVETGANRAYLISVFIGSSEFSNICAGYDLSVGTANIPNIHQAGTRGEWDGIDVSAHQGNIDWTAVKNAGYEFVIIRATTYKNSVPVIDPYFVSNVRGAKAAGLRVGTYCFSYSNTTWGVDREIDTLMSAIGQIEAEGYRLDYPVFWDVEDSDNKWVSSMDRQELTTLTKYALDTIRDKGYYTGLYTYTSMLKNRFYMDQLSEYDVWVAQWSSEVTYEGIYNMWQYTSDGSVPGIGGRVDLDRSYVHYPSIIKNAGMNRL